MSPPPTPPCVVPALAFHPQDPSADPFVGEKLCRSLEAANYRVLTTRWLSPKCPETFQQLEDSYVLNLFVVLRYNFSLCIQKQTEQCVKLAL